MDSKNGEYAKEVSELLQSRVEQEEWRIIEDSGGYQVSNLGNVKKPNGVLAKQYIGSVGYYEVWIYYNSQSWSPRVHTLIMKSFVGEPNGLVTDHINGNKLDNRLCNLEYVTQSENIKRAIRQGRFKNNGPRKGEDNYRSLLSNVGMKQMLELYFQGTMYRREVAERFRIKKEALDNIIYRYKNGMLDYLNLDIKNPKEKIHPMARRTSGLY